MDLFGSDTSPAAAKILVEGYRRMTPIQKLQRVVDLTATVRLLAETRIREQYPNATTREVKLRLGALTLGADLMKKAFGWDPEREGW